jgi:hypothetical protein
MEPEEADVTVSEAEMIDKIFDLGETAVREVMVPLVDVAALPETASPADVVRLIQERGFSRIPVFTERVFNIVGVVTAMDLLRRGAEAPDLRALMRYVPGCKGPWEKEGDSWYHYVPLAALGIMAQEGDEPARRLFFDSLDWAIRAAQYFDYRWPVMFDVKTFKVLRGPREPGQPGESDVGGVYAYLMMTAHELTGDEKYLREAENAIRAMDGFGFNVVYETSGTAWGARGALRVWKATGDRFYLDQSYMLLAGFIQNAFLWESSLGSAQHFPIFWGVKAMFSIAYKASYEINDAFTAFLK